MKQLIWTWKGR